MVQLCERFKKWLSEDNTASELWEPASRLYCDWFKSASCSYIFLKLYTTTEESGHF